MSKILSCKKALETYLLIGLIVPVLINSFSNPAVKQYFIASVSGEFVAQIDAIEELLGLVIVGIALTHKGIPIFVKLYPLMSAIAIIGSFTIAIMGPEYIAERFYIKAFTTAIVFAIIRQGQKNYIFQIWQGIEVRDLENKLTISAGLAGFGGAIIASFVIDSFSIDTLLWINAIVTLISMIFNYILFIAMKRIVEAAEE